MDFFWSDYRPTEHECSTCGFMLLQVWPSTMVVCDNPTCSSEPMYLVGDSDD